MTTILDILIVLKTLNLHDECSKRIAYNHNDVFVSYEHCFVEAISNISVQAMATILENSSYIVNILTFNWCPF